LICGWACDIVKFILIQYFMQRKQNIIECENYIKDDYGRHTGCRFQNVIIKNNYACFLVNGSRSGQNVESYEKKIMLYEIEKLMPPSNITVNCGEIKNDCIIQWQQPQISHSNKDMCFKYEINIKYKVRMSSLMLNINSCICEGGNSNIFLRSNTRKKYILKMRAAGSTCLVNPAWGEWSAPVEFGKNKSIPWATLPPVMS
ncbi:CSF2R factor, partial [Pomatorhinus ruficollis]|nr:CSF2R factor [Pomatorhinus ruficollis]